MYSNRSGAIQWDMPDFLSHGNSNMFAFLQSCQNSHFETFDLSNFKIYQGQDVQHSQLSNHDFLSCGNSNVCSISHYLQDIRKINKTPKV